MSTTKSKGKKPIPSYPLCRACLTNSPNVVDLNSDFKSKEEDEKDQTVRASVVDILEQVTSCKILLSNGITNSMCLMCMSSLKMAHTFISDFITNQHKLEMELGYSVVFNEGTVNRNSLKFEVEEEGEEEEETISIVTKAEPLDYEESDNREESIEEIFIGDQKLHFGDVVVIENEEDKIKGNYDDVLRNVETEMDTLFAEDKTEKKKSVKKEKPTPTTALVQKKRKYTPRGQGPTPRKNRVDEPRKCPQPDCKYETTSLRSWYLHRSKHVPSAPTEFVCETCGHVSHSQSSRYHHRRKHMGKLFQCDWCPKKYDTSSRLKVHVKTHQNLREYLCQVCGKDFNYAMSLKYHMQLHSDHKDYVCSYCGLRFRLPQGLRRHVLTHTKERPFNCKYCQKSFPSQSEKKKHEMLHTDERPYACSHCEKGYVSRWLLQCHLGTHSGEHECYLCDRSFIEAVYLDKHLQKVHGMEAQ